MFDIFYYGPKPNLFAHEQSANSFEHAAELSRTRYYWYIYGGNDYTNFNFDMIPPSWEWNHVYVWPSQWQRNGNVYLACKWEHGPLHYMEDQRVKSLPNKQSWMIPKNIDEESFDFSWHPDPAEKYIHIFGTQWQPNSGPEYHTPGAVKTKYESVQKAIKTVCMDNWIVPDNVDTSQFDFSWHPRTDENYIHVFGSQWARQGGPEYHSLGATQIKYESAQKVKGKITIDIFVVDQFNKNSKFSLESVQKQHNAAKKIRGVGNWASIIKKACETSTCDFVWVVSSDYDYSNFDFGWYPETWQSNMIHVFGSRYQKWANVFRVPRHEFLRLGQWFSDIKQFPELNFVSDQSVELFDDNREIWYIDHSNNHTFEQHLDHKTTRFFSTWLETLGRICERTDSEYIWVTSSTCDYTNFDFGWEPEPWQKDMLHVFPSCNQREGDTFLVPVERFKSQHSTLKVLGWFDTINYVEDVTVPYRPWPTVNALHEVTQSYSWILNTDTKALDYVPSFWKKPDLHVFTQSGSVLLVPRDCKQHFSTQFYDYPYILRHNDYNIEEKLLDVVYLSNGEKNADKNWFLLKCMCPRAKRIDGVTGRAEAYKACAEISETPWFFNVFAKCIVEPDFNFNWQPDWLQGPKHWIFHSRNPVNGLEYGHMGIIAYHKQMVLDATEWGLDFTLSASHGVVPVIASTADFNTTPYETWRTAFRECVKLTQQSDIESRYRLEQWTTVGNGENGKWSVRGAEDAVKYVEDGNDLQQTFEWAFLKEFFDSHYNS
jgi:hypothetical protein